MNQAASVIIKECMNVKEDESVLIITDSEKRKIGDAIFEAAKKITPKIKVMEIPIGKRHGEEPLPEIAGEMKNFDVIIIPTVKSLSHTKARIEASKTGARIATMPGITEEIMKRCIDIDYDKLKKVHERLRKVLIGSKEVKIVTEIGTDVVTSVTKVCGEYAGLYHDKGNSGNLPTGEVDSGVKENATNGVIFVDTSFTGIKLKSPLKLEIKDGYVISIDGEDANKLKEMLDAVGKEAYKIAELGIGTNPKAIVSGNTLEDEKVLGTVHFGIGNDLIYGGRNGVQIHLDGVITKPTIYIDGNKIIEKGELLLNKL